MGYVPGLENDVFISYGHEANRFPAGWVRELHAFLQDTLQNICSRSVTIWRDPRLAGGDYIEDRVFEAIDRSAIFVSILTPGFAESEWCSKEALRFAEGPAAALALPGTSRLIRVIKAPLIDAPWPRGLEAEVLHYELYDYDDQAQTVRTYFSTIRSDPSYPRFVEKGTQLAQAISGMLRRLKRAADQRQTAPIASERTVFVAEVTDDVRDAGHEARVVAELEDRGFRVARTGRTAAEGLRAAGEQTIALAASTGLAIHVVGRNYGAVPEGETESLPAMQLRVVQERALARASEPSTPQLRQVVWQAAGVEPLEPRQEQLLAALRKHKVTEVIVATESQFKSALLDLLGGRAEPPAPQGQTRYVFLLCSRKDITDPELQAIRAWLQRQGYPADLPVYQGDSVELARLEEERIIEADATVIFYGTAEDAWVRQKRTAIQKAWAKVAGRRPYVRAVYLARPEDDLKQAQYRLAEGRRVLEPDRFSPLLVLGDCSPFTPESLVPLVESFNPRVAAGHP